MTIYAVFEGYLAGAEAMRSHMVFYVGGIAGVAAAAAFDSIAREIG